MRKSGRSRRGAQTPRGDAFHPNPPGTPTRSGTVAQLAVQWETTPRKILIPPHSVKYGEDKTSTSLSPLSSPSSVRKSRFAQRLSWRDAGEKIQWYQVLSAHRMRNVGLSRKSPKWEWAGKSIYLSNRFEERDTGRLRRTLGELSERLLRLLSLNEHVLWRTSSDLSCPAHWDRTLPVFCPSLSLPATPPHGSHWVRRIPTGSL